MLRKAIVLGLLFFNIGPQSLRAQTSFPADPNRELIQISSHAFWRKPKYFQKIVEDRSILVNVRSSKIKQSAKEAEKLPAKQTLNIEGAGMVDRTVDQSYSTLKQFSRWKEMSDYIQSSTYDPSTKILKLHLLAFRYHARMNMRIFFDDKEPSPKALRFLVLDGEFKDMKGVLEFKDHERRKAVISMTVYDEFDKLPLPEFFIEFGLEVVFQKMAERMRSFIEKEHPRP